MVSPEESFIIEIVAGDLDDLNDKKNTSEKINDENLLAKLTAVSQIKWPQQTVGFGLVDNAATPPAMPHRLQNPKWPLGGPKMADVVWKGV